MHYFSIGRQPSTVASLRAERRMLNDIPFDAEVGWAQAYLLGYADLLSSFSSRRAQFSNAILNRSPSSSLLLLDDIDCDFGLSLWSIEQRLCLLQLSQGLEAQKRFTQEIKEQSQSGTVRFLVTLWSIRNERATHFETFRQELKERLPYWTENREFSDYALFRCADELEPSARAFARMLQWEFTSPVIDLYEVFVRLGFRSVCARHSTAPVFGEACAVIAKSVRDDRLSKIALIAQSAGRRTEGLNIASLSLSDAKYSGEDTRPSTDSIAVSYSNIAATASGPGQANVFAAGSIGAEIVSDLRNIEEKRAGFENAQLQLFHLLQNMTGLDVRRALLWHSSDLSASEDKPDSSCFEAIITAPDLDPALLRCAKHSGADQIVATMMSLASGSSTIQAELLRAGVITPTDAPLVCAAYVGELRATALYDNGAYEEVVALVDSDASQLPQVKRRVMRLKANALLSLGRTIEAIRYIAAAVLRDPLVYLMMPIRRCYQAITDEVSSAIAGDLSLPIVVELYSRQLPDMITTLRYKYEDFLTSHGCARPSELRSMADQFSTSHLVHFLRNVCTVRVMQLSVEFPTSRAVREERLAVCAFLRDLDPEHRPVYDAEMLDVTKQQEITRGLQEVEQSKIWIDQQRIRGWAENNLQEMFSRLMDLHSAGLLSEIKAVGDAVEPPPSDGVTRSSDVPELPANEASDLLLRMIIDFLRVCFLSKPHGLDSYLSIRVRHGVLAGQMRAAPEAEKIVTLQREAGSHEYSPAQHWIDRIGFQNQDVAREVDERLRRFSQEYDNLVDRFIKNHLQVRRRENDTGMFRLGYIPTDLLLLQADLHRQTSFQTFVDRCFQIFWNSVDASLEDVRQYIDSTLQKELNGLFVDLIGEIESITLSCPNAELSHAVRNALTRASNSLEQVKQWFRPAQPRTSVTASMQHLVEISLQVVRNMDPEFDPELIMNTGELPFIVQLQRFTDVFINLFDNIRKHSGLKKNVRIDFVATSGPNHFELEVLNDIAPGVANSINEAKLNAIREHIKQGTHLTAVTGQGGTGLLKIRSMLLADTVDPTHFVFGFVGDEKFAVRLRLPSVFITVGGEHDEDADRGR